MWATHLMQFTASNIFFSPHNLCHTLPLSANKCNCPQIRPLSFLLLLGSPPASSFGAASSTCHLSRYKTPFPMQCSFQSLLPLRILRVYFQATLHSSHWACPNQKKHLPASLMLICTAFFHLPLGRDALWASCCSSPPVRSSACTDTLSSCTLSWEDTWSRLTVLPLPFQPLLLCTVLSNPAVFADDTRYLARGEKLRC